jgi:hypothetical protein
MVCCDGYSDAMLSVDDVDGIKIREFLPHHILLTDFDSLNNWN